MPYKASLPLPPDATVRQVLELVAHLDMQPVPGYVDTQLVVSAAMAARRLLAGQSFN